MVNKCFVVNCNNTNNNKLKGNADKNENLKQISFFLFPKVISKSYKPLLKFGKEENKKKIIELSKQRQKSWIFALRRGSITSTQLENGRICSKHFISGNYQNYS